MEQWRRFTLQNWERELRSAGFYMSSFPNPRERRPCDTEFTWVRARVWLCKANNAATSPIIADLVLVWPQNPSYAKVHWSLEPLSKSSGMSTQLWKHILSTKLRLCNYDKIYCGTRHFDLILGNPEIIALVSPAQSECTREISTHTDSMNCGCTWFRVIQAISGTRSGVRDDIVARNYVGRSWKRSIGLLAWQHHGISRIRVTAESWYPIQLRTDCLEDQYRRPPVERCLLLLRLHSYLRDSLSIWLKRLHSSILDSSDSDFVLCKSAGRKGQSQTKLLHNSEDQLLAGANRNFYGFFFSSRVISIHQTES